MSDLQLQVIIILKNEALNCALCIRTIQPWDLDIEEKSSRIFRFGFQSEVLSVLYFLVVKRFNAGQFQNDRALFH